MQSNKRISELLVETGAYHDLDKPVILTSGELGIYYVNTEKLVQDNGKFEEYGDDSEAMIDHALKMMEEHDKFDEVIDILSDGVHAIFLNETKKRQRWKTDLCVWNTCACLLSAFYQTAERKRHEPGRDR